MQYDCAVDAVGLSNNKQPKQSQKGAKYNFLIFTIQSNTRLAREMISRTRFVSVSSAKKRTVFWLSLSCRSTMIGILFAFVNICSKTRAGFRKCAKLIQMLDFKTL